MCERELFFEPVLAVEPIAENFDPNATPTDGIEYLQHVNYEAKMCDQVVVANIDVKKFEKKRTPILPVQPEVKAGREEFLPSIELQNEWLADFSEVRLAVERRRSIQMNYNFENLPIPMIEHDRGWYQFCVGDYTPSPEQSNCMALDDKVGEKLHKECSLNNSHDENLDGSTVVKSESTIFEWSEPKLHLLAAMNQVTIIAVLDYHVHWLENMMTDFKHSGPWLYALLACLEIPLIPETCSNIRSLARLASKCRSKLKSPENEVLDVLNLIICLVGKYFRQLDLADS